MLCVMILWVTASLINILDLVWDADCVLDCRERILSDGSARAISCEGSSRFWSALFPEGCPCAILFCITILMCPCFVNVVNVPAIHALRLYCPASRTSAKNKSRCSRWWDWTPRVLWQGYRRYWSPEIKSLQQELAAGVEQRESALKDILMRLVHDFCKNNSTWLSAVQTIAGTD